MDLAEKLKNAPRGFKMYSPIWGDVYLEKVTILPDGKKCIETDNGNFTAEGKYSNFGEVLLFPSYNNKNWDTVNINASFEPFQKVIAWNGMVWCAQFYSHYSKSMRLHVCIGGACYVEVLPYNEDTKHLIGTNKDSYEI